MCIQLPSTTYERQSSLDQHWNDIFSIIEMNSTTQEMSHDTVVSDLDSFDLQSNTAAAVVQNASMNLALEPLIEDSYTSQTSKYNSYEICMLTSVKTVTVYGENC